MTELIEKNVPYEILIRLNEDGSIHGAHYQTLHQIHFGDRLLKNEPNLPVSLSSVDGKLDKAALTNAIGESMAHVLVELARAKKRIADLEAEVVKREDYGKALAQRDKQARLAMRQGLIG